MPRDKNTSSLGKARGGPRRTTRLDHREVLITTKPAPTSEKKDLSVTSTDEGGSGSSSDEIEVLVVPKVKPKESPVLAKQAQTTKRAKLVEPKVKAKIQRVLCHFCALSQNKVSLSSIDTDTVAEYFLTCSTCGNTHCKKCCAVHLVGQDWEKVKEDPNWRCLSCDDCCCCSKVECVERHDHCTPYKKVVKTRQMMQKLKDTSEGVMTRKRKRELEPVAKESKRQKTSHTNKTQKKKGKQAPKPKTKAQAQAPAPAPAPVPAQIQPPEPSEPQPIDIVFNPEPPISFSEVPEVIEAIPAEPLILSQPIDLTQKAQVAEEKAEEKVEEKVEEKAEEKVAAPPPAKKEEENHQSRIYQSGQKATEKAKERRSRSREEKRTANAKGKEN